MELAHGDRLPDSEQEAHLDSCAVCRELLVRATSQISGVDCFASTRLPDSEEYYCDDATVRDISPFGAGIGPGARLAERFRIIRVLGRGGMGVVYEAFDEQICHPVALKILAPHLVETPQLVDRLRREVVLARRIAHPGVCRVYDFGVSGETYFITMELIEGRSLRQALSGAAYGDEPLTPSAATTWLDAILEALQAIHGAGVVHRDLKPGNVMVGLHDRVVVMDFGLAGDLQGEDSLSAAAVGTPAYWSPEQARGESATPRSDLFALGLIARDLQKACGNPSELHRWNKAIDTCLRRRQEERYPTATAARRAFARSRRRGVWLGVVAAAAILFAGVGAAPVVGEQLTDESEFARRSPKQTRIVAPTGTLSADPAADPANETPAAEAAVVATPASETPAVPVDVAAAETHAEVARPARPRPRRTTRPARRNGAASSAVSASEPAAEAPTMQEPLWFFD
ncbi:MAG: serine/threonine-protein kinase [Myxococcota bacterium]